MHGTHNFINIILYNIPKSKKLMHTLFLTVLYFGAAGLFYIESKFFMQ